MAYQVSTVTNAANVKATIETFAVSNGWTLSGGILSKGQSFVRLTDSGSNDIRLDGATSADFVNDIAPAFVRGYISSWPATAYLFAHANPDAIFCVIEYNVDYYEVIAFGDLENKIGDWVGGNWFSASRCSGSTSTPYVMLDDSPNTFYGTERDWPSSGGVFVEAYGTGGGSYGYGSSFIHCEIDGKIWWHNNLNKSPLVKSNRFAVKRIRSQPNAWDQQAILIPIQLYAQMPSSLWSPIGNIPHARFCRIDNYDPGDIITLGSDRWMVFPFVKKKISARDGGFYTDKHSGTLGWAVRYDGP